MTLCLPFASRLENEDCSPPPGHRGALIKVLATPHLDLTTPLGRGFILSAMAEDERQRLVKRANDGRKAARSNGVRFGRKPKLTDHQQAETLKRLDAGESCRSIARAMAVHHATISRLAG
jgi:DNA invertase Pin-like site-specific DNA recombinase